MKPKAKIFFTVTFTLILFACGSSPTQEASPTEDASLLATTLPAATPTSFPEILPTPAAISSFNERLLASFEIFKEPDEMVFLQGFIWTKTADGHLVQIDPATNMVTADIKVDTTSDTYHYCQGLGTDGENIWVCSAGDDGDNRITNVVRVDPVSKSVIETIKVNKVFDQLDLPFLLNQIWVLSENGTELVGIDVTTNQPSASIDLGTRCFQLAVVDNFLMATCKLDNLVLQIDVDKMEVTARITLKSPGYIAGDENGVWVALDSSIVRLDPKSLIPIVAFTNFPGAGSTGDIFVTQEAVWVRQESGFLYQIDPANNQIVEQIAIEENLASGSVLVTSDSIWATSYDDNLLMRLSLK